MENGFKKEKTKFTTEITENLIVVKKEKNTENTEEKRKQKRNSRG